MIAYLTAEGSAINFVFHLLILFLALEVEGIFRVGASVRTVNDIKSKFQKGEKIDWSRFDAHTIAGVLKMYLRELPEPLLLQVYGPYKELVDAKSKRDCIFPY